MIIQKLNVITGTNSNSNKIITIETLPGSRVCGGRHEWNAYVEYMGFGPLDV